MIVLVLARLPELVEAGAADDESGIDLEAVRAELGVLKELFEGVLGGEIDERSREG